jgi:hypothetical protein
MALTRYAIVDGETVINVIDYEIAPSNPPSGFENPIIAVQSDLAGPDWTYINGEFVSPPVLQPTPQQLIDTCKQTAISLLQATDWSELPSVTNTSNPHHLVNYADFITYRMAVRAYAINPVENPIWPMLPTEQWSA